MKNLMSMSMVLFMSFFLSVSVSAQTEVAKASCSKEKSELCKKVCTEKASATVMAVSLSEIQQNVVNQNEVVKTDCALKCDPNDCPPACQKLCSDICKKSGTANAAQVKMVNIETLNKSGVPACSSVPSCKPSPACKPTAAKSTKVALAQG